jgi:adenosylmethionine-8-amino-7-oxononanoate aminotransferase
MRLWKNGKIFATDYLVENQTWCVCSKHWQAEPSQWQLRLYTRVIWCFYDDDINKALFHGHTFTANLRVRGSITSLELLQTSEMQANIVRVNQFGIWKACQKSSASSDNPSFGSHFALEIKPKVRRLIMEHYATSSMIFFIENGICDLSGILFIFTSLCHYGTR